jgi:probable HAF family extracellular repeat protein
MKRALFAALAAAMSLTAASSFALDFKTVDYPGATQTILFALNDREQVVGQFTDSAGATHAFHADHGHFQPVDPEGAIGQSKASHAYSIDVFGEIAGSYADSANVLHGFTVRGGEVTPIDYPGGYPTEAYGVNDLGHVIGVYYSPDGNLHAFERKDGVYAAADVPGSLTTVPLSINDRGQVVGYYVTVAGTVGQGYVREPDGAIRTWNAAAAPANSSFLISVNNFDFALGGYVDASGNVDNLLVFGNRSEPLALPASFGATATSFQTINDLGEMVGYYVDAQGHAHGFFAVP